MSIKEKLEVIDYICRHCKRAYQLGYDCMTRSEYPIFYKTEEERFETCHILRERVDKIDQVFNRSIFIGHGTVESKDI